MDPQTAGSAAGPEPVALPTMADLDELTADLDAIDRALADLDQTNPDRRGPEPGATPEPQ